MFLTLSCRSTRSNLCGVSNSYLGMGSISSCATTILLLNISLDYWQNSLAYSCWVGDTDRSDGWYTPLSCLLVDRQYYHCITLVDFPFGVRKSD
jgi:hypothetical protein